MIDILIWSLAKPGRCGVGDHSRLLARNLNGTIRSAGEPPPHDSDICLLQYVPTSWSAHTGWAGAAVDKMSRGRRILFAHELERTMTGTIRSVAGWLSDHSALRVALRSVDEVVVTTQARALSLQALLEIWGLERPIHIVGVPSNVHARDPSESPQHFSKNRRVVIFAPSSDRESAHQLAASAAWAVRNAGAKIDLLGRRGGRDFVGREFVEGYAPLRAATTVHGELPARQVAKLIEGAQVGLATANTGVGGRRGSFAALLAGGIPVVGVGGVDTDSHHRASQGLFIASERNDFNAELMGESLGKVLDMKSTVWQRHSLAARQTYLRHHSWQALQEALDKGKS